MDKTQRLKIENEWAKYKYCVMEKSYQQYKEISKNVGCGNYSYIEFINLIQSILESEDKESQIINTLYHIWGYFKQMATEEEKLRFFSSIDQYKQGQCPINEIKKLLYKYAIQYNSSYLLNSYYLNGYNKQDKD